MRWSAAPETIAPLRRTVPPYTLNVAAAVALPAAFEDLAYYEWYLAQVRESRRLLCATLDRLDVKYWPSSANFVLARFGEESRASDRRIGRAAGRHPRSIAEIPDAPGARASPPAWSSTRRVASRRWRRSCAARRSKQSTTETSIALRLELDGRGRYEVSTGIRFFDHMLELVTRHGGFDLKIAAKGDLDVDQHHTVEDVGIALGEAVSMALGNRRGINRAGYFVMPMDETLGVAAIDLSGRVHAVVDLQIEVEKVGDLQSELVTDFFEGFAQGARANVHVKVLYGRSNHHKVEALFKAFARALRFCVLTRPAAKRTLPSTKGLL